MNPDRSWMYNRNNPGRAGMIPEFAEGVTRFINHAMTLDDFLNSRLIRCPCVNCENVRYHTTETVAMHLQAQLTFLFESGKILPPCPASSDGSDQEGDENDKSDKESEGDENGKSDKESEGDEE
ncbi:hypothetical protein KY284_010481 [Solanum tuberosum]|nr:hypothetical protein KY284_010481 [Solanum tuberosum]